MKSSDKHLLENKMSTTQKRIYQGHGFSFSRTFIHIDEHSFMIFLFQCHNYLYRSCIKLVFWD